MKLLIDLKVVKVLYGRCQVALVVEILGIRTDESGCEDGKPKPRTGGNGTYYTLKPRRERWNEQTVLPNSSGYYCRGTDRDVPRLIWQLPCS